MQIGIDTFLINLINGPKNSFVKEKLEGAQLYSVSVGNNSMLYDKDILTYLNNLNTYRTNNKIIAADPLLVLIDNANISNIKTCSTTNPLTNPLCMQMASTNENIASNIKNITRDYCSNNISDPKCVNFINSNQTIFNTNEVNNKMLNYCMNEGINDTANCKPFSSINGSSEWLKKNTLNITKPDGTIGTVCGTDNGLSISTCQKVCNQYPELCESDIQQKCILPNNRYSPNIDTFTEKENYDSPEDPYNFLLYQLLVILAIIFMTSIGVYKLNSYKQNRIKKLADKIS
jgi:hypothetical protein